MKKRIIKYLIVSALVLVIIYVLMLVWNKENIANYENVVHNTVEDACINCIEEEEIVNTTIQEEKAISTDDIKQEEDLNIKPIQEKVNDNIKQQQSVVKKESSNVEIIETKKTELDKEEPIKENVKEKELPKESTTQKELKSTPIVEEKNTEEKKEQQITCNHSNSKYYNTKNEAISEYDRIINEWSDKWINNEIDDETYYKSCPDGYEIFSCPYCNKWTISLYY